MPPEAYWGMSKFLFVEEFILTHPWEPFMGRDRGTKNDATNPS